VKLNIFLRKDILRFNFSFFQLRPPVTPLDLHVKE